MKSRVDADHRSLGVALYNSSWALLEKPDRTPEEADELLHQAHASAYHAGESSPRRSPIPENKEIVLRDYATL